MIKPYPLLFEPMLLTKVWGGDRLALFGKAVEPGAGIGESWELTDMAATSAGGAGGGAFRSVIANGPLAGRTLHDALRMWGDDLVGCAARAPDGGYPLLVKYLDAREHLSVQVHPSPAYAATHAGAFVKSECWLILGAEPGAVIYKGLRPGVTRESMAEAIKTGGVVDQIVAVPAVVGECHNLPSGTCHALGAGVVVLEVQTASDTTFRVHDWGRAGRELHIAQALECIEFGASPPEPVRFGGGGADAASLVTPNFVLTQCRIGPEGMRMDDQAGAFMVIAGRGTLTGWLGAEAPVKIGAGTTGLVPLGAGPVRLIGEGGDPLVCVRARPV